MVVSQVMAVMAVFIYSDGSVSNDGSVANDARGPTLIKIVYDISKSLDFQKDFWISPDFC